MEESKVIDIDLKKKYVKSEDFNKYYVTGAIGGFRNPYDFRLTFFNVDSNDFLIKTQKFKERKDINDTELRKELFEMGMPHILQCELIMTEQAVKELHNFLGKELKILEDTRKKNKN